MLDLTRPILLLTVPHTGTMFTLRELAMPFRALVDWDGSTPVAFAHFREQWAGRIAAWPHQILTTFRDPRQTWASWARRGEYRRPWFDYCWRQWAQLRTDFVVDIERRTAPFPVTDWTPENSRGK